MRWRQQEDKPTEQRIERKSNAFKSSIDQHQITLIFNFTLSKDLYAICWGGNLSVDICFSVFCFFLVQFKCSTNFGKIRPSNDLLQHSQYGIFGILHSISNRIDLIFLLFVFSIKSSDTVSSHLCSIDTPNTACVSPRSNNIKLQQLRLQFLIYIIMICGAFRRIFRSLVSIQFLFCDFGFYLGKSWNKQQHQHCPLITICKVSMIIFVNSHNLCLIAWFVLLYNFSFIGIAIIINITLGSLTRKQKENSQGKKNILGDSVWWYQIRWKRRWANKTEI